MKIDIYNNSINKLITYSSLHSTMMPQIQRNTLSTSRIIHWRRLIIQQYHTQHAPHTHVYILLRASRSVRRPNIGVGTIYN